MSYYTDQLNKIEVNSRKWIKIRGGDTTNFLELNTESIPAIVAFLQAELNRLKPEIATWFEPIKERRGFIVEVNQELYEYALGTVPPIYAKGCWGMGEADSHASDGTPYYYFFKEINGRFFSVLTTQKFAEVLFHYKSMEVLSFGKTAE